MLLIMAVTLYTAQIILKALGIEDFGIYNITGGLAASFVFFSSSLSNATQRFLSVELGKGDIVKVCNIFNISLLIYLGMTIIVFLFAETIGLWFIKNKLIIPIERLNSALWVFQMMIISLSLTLIGSVFNAVLIARENMKIYAYVGIFEAAAKLIIALILVNYTNDRLKLYASLLLGVTIVAQTATAIVCFRKYPECHLRLYWNKRIFKNMLGFTSWNGIGTAVWVINEQGTNILLNIFFGPTVNAAKAIASQVNTAVNNFSTGFFTATRPQIIKLYANNDRKNFINLIFKSSRFSFYLLWFFCLPIILRVNYILNLWLKNVPEYSSRFVTWILIFSLINVLNNPFWCAIQATGKLKYYILIGSLTYLIAFPISYILLKYGNSPVIVFQILAGIRFIYLIVTIYIVKHYIRFSVVDYFCKVLFPITKVILITSAILFIINFRFIESFNSLLIISTISTISIALSIYIVGITSDERKWLIHKVYRNK